MYILKILRCLWLARCILICCSSVSLWLVVCGVFNVVKIMSFFMYVISYVCHKLFNRFIIGYHLPRRHRSSRGVKRKKQNLHSFIAASFNAQ